MLLLLFCSPRIETETTGGVGAGGTKSEAVGGGDEFFIILSSESEGALQATLTLLLTLSLCVVGLEF